MCRRLDVKIECCAECPFFASEYSEKKGMFYYCNHPDKGRYWRDEDILWMEVPKGMKDETGFDVPDWCPLPKM